MTEGDVFRFAYNDAARERAKTSGWHSDLHWCFDGQLVCRDGRLCDTYWGLTWGGDGGRSFTPAKAEAEGTLTFVCNLQDVETIHEGEYPLYADGDAFDLSHQHGCYKFYAKKRGAKKDRALMLAALRQKVTDARKTVERDTWNLECAIRREEQLSSRIEAGEEPHL